MRQLQTIYDNIILVSESIQTDIKNENSAITENLCYRHSCVRKTTKQKSKLKTKQLQTFYDHVIFVSESLQTDIEIEKEAITDHLW